MQYCKSFIDVMISWMFWNIKSSDDINQSRLDNDESGKVVRAQPGRKLVTRESPLPLKTL